MSLPPNFATNFTRETWALYGVGIAILVLRLVERTRRAKSLRHLQVEDWIAFQLIGWFTLLTAALNKVINGGGSNFMTPEEEAALTPETTRERIIGSKFVLASEFGMIMTIWSCKAIMLLVYRRLTSGLKQERYILGVGIWVGLGFVATVLALFINCRPFSGYWSVPAIDSQCWSYYNFGYVEAVFNITADIAVLIVGMPLIINVQRPWQQKVPLVLIFGMGLFVIAAALTNKLYAYLPWLLSYNYAFWYMREAAVSVYVTNLPALWSIVREVFPATQTWGYGGTTGSRGPTLNSQANTRLEMKGFRRTDSLDLDLEKSPSEERINRLDRSSFGTGEDWAVHKTRQVTVEEDSASVYMEGRGRGGESTQRPASIIAELTASNRGKSQAYISSR
ncbi:hypothetical protein C1H76_4086 [Elsinoe australis]|uniref:Rhodopsin domain-containing protein n=1 Tax=Elsinoe australis TaxID=40998 RepID=A0A4U7B601_9PEZI|nr:hypothetical protein C1H76_4086 [Elsinoe australis]